MRFLQFAFIVVLPLLLVAGAVVSLFAVGALFDVLDNPKQMRARVEGLFRAGPSVGRPTRADHYYRPYWAGR
jgi:hypothetical protein